MTPIPNQFGAAWGIPSEVMDNKFRTDKSTHAHRHTSTVCFHARWPAGTTRAFASMLAPRTPAPVLFTRTHTHMDTNTKGQGSMYLGRDIAGGETGAPGGQDEVELLLVAPVHQRLLRGERGRERGEEKRAGNGEREGRRDGEGESERMREKERGRAREIRRDRV